MKNYYIAIEGGIGVGKTTLARLIRDEFHAQVLLEIFEENPFLARFYQDRARYAFQTQLFFLLSRYQQQHNAIPAALAEGNLLSDYTFEKNQIFARLTMSGDELEMFERIYVILAEKIPRPDLIVYLTADTDVLMERIAIRDRSYERTMERAYIESLNQAYEEFFAHHAATPVLPIDTNDLNIVQRKEDLAVVVQSIRAKLAESAYQQPLL